jgi:hypothetical protein
VRASRPDRPDHVHGAPVYLKPLKSGADEDDGEKRRNPLEVFMSGLKVVAALSLLAEALAAVAFFWRPSR